MDAIMKDAAIQEAIWHNEFLAAGCRTCGKARDYLKATRDVGHFGARYRLGSRSDFTRA